MARLGCTESVGVLCSSPCATRIASSSARVLLPSVAGRTFAGRARRRSCPSGIGPSAGDGAWGVGGVMMVAMVELPTGTVTLLFSDVAGSTVLLSRLGAAYADALDGQRQVLRKAWAEHGGVELGTEGDSFYVVFPTAPAAVTAAAQAQRELAVFQWPAGERVRVRMGIHTGAPTVHDGAYVGMDVHRAARIAGAAHGGQVVVSEATAHLVDSCLPNGVELRDLGSHQLKDIAQPEHLFQLAVEGLPAEFAPLKTLGAASSLPRPATPLVGRDGELAELTALMGSPGVRLVTLTGPGGSGKTRLAVGLAQQLVEQFPDGVFFVSLAAVTVADVMWTSIAETLGVPPEGRVPPGLFTHVAHRSALFVLDNLEQLPGADGVVAELLVQAPQVVVVTTTRRPLAVDGEHVHPVPPLELPDTAELGDAGASGAVQLFVEHAQMVRPGFRLTADNVADVTAVCRRLDGLPLAIQLAAARIRLLGPKAILARLDQALDLATTGSQGPGRQKTLRDTIGWSYDLLTSEQQGFFRRLGVFAGGADLDAVTAVTTVLLGERDLLDLIADLVDANLVIVGESLDGEPRVAMLETIRAYALDQLRKAQELADVCLLHARHYLAVVEQLRPMMFGAGGQLLQARRRFEVELDNVRAALSWALEPAEPGGRPAPDHVQVAVELCAEAWASLPVGGYFAEARQWLGRAVSVAAGDDSPALGKCLSNLASACMFRGDLERADEVATRSVAMWRRLGDNDGLSTALGWLALCRQDMGDLQAARAAVEEAVVLARDLNDKIRLGYALLVLGLVEYDAQNFERALEHLEAAADIFHRLGNELGALRARHNIACALRSMGRPGDAERQMRQQIPQVLRLGPPEFHSELAEDYAAVLAELDHHQSAARLLGAADAMHERIGIPRDPGQEAEITEAFAKARAALPAAVWDEHYQHGYAMTVEDLLTELHANPPAG